MSEVKTPQLIQANKSKDPAHQILDSLAKDHYLVLQEKEQWVKGVKVSNPAVRVISEGDMHSFLEDKYFEKHEITVNILHDPTLGTAAEKKLDTTKVTKKKEEYVKELAELLQIDVKDIDPKLTIAKLEVMIEEAKKAAEEAAAAGGGGSTDPDPQ